MTDESDDHTAATTENGGDHTTLSRGILAAGAYAPHERISAETVEAVWGQSSTAGIEEKAVAAPDEDAVTMGYEAARRALAATEEAIETPSDSLDRLAFATTTPPTAEEDPTVQLAEMLGLSSARVQLYTGSTRAGTQALLGALRESGYALVVAADCPRGEADTALEHAAGAGAAAFVVGPAAPAVLRASGRSTALAQGTRFRRTGDETIESLGITTYEREVFVETILGAVEEIGDEEWDDREKWDTVAIQAPDGRLPYRAGRALGIDPSAIRDCLPVQELGDLGAASVPVGLVEALDAETGVTEDEAESTTDDTTTVLAVSFGSGAGADALVFNVRGVVPVQAGLGGDTQLSYAEYLQRRGELTSGPPDGGGAYVSIPAWQRTLDQRYRLEGGRCPACSALAFPPSGACPECHELVEYESVQLQGTGEVEAVTVISRGGAPPEFAEQQAQSGDFAVAIVALDGPGDESVSTPAQVITADPTAVKVGDHVETTIRRIYTQEGVTRYGFKVQPVE